MSKLFLHLWSLIKKPKRSELVPSHQIYTLWLLRILTLLTGIYQLFWGEFTIGFITLLTFAIITTPTIFTRNSIKKLPIELELIFFVMVFFQFVLGEANHFYINIPYYDKIIHTLLPLLIGYTTFILMYTMWYTDKLDTSLNVMFVITFLIAMGIGAVWEILEYLNDVYLVPLISNWHHFQGSATENQFYDTMHDLIADMVGAVMGATLAYFYIARTKKSKGSRKLELIKEVAKEILV
ncbi:MAG: hypothetical protein QG570_207 [Patescibacteria group bacterium]|nr:hypothetical protein [Patescibacteria group bacterium]